jgi:hypothetical protein
MYLYRRVLMDNFIPKEANGFPGFFEIPGYGKYAINPDGVVINKETHSYLEGSRNPDGYVNYRLTGDGGYCLTWGRHRLMCFVFKHPGVDITPLIVNHINTIKGDDRLNNLEWTTYQGNAEHAGAMGITEKCIPISVRDVDTGEIVKYPSIVECARFMGMTKDAINYRIKIGEQRVFPERKQYRLSHSDEPWYIPDSIERELMINSTSKPVLVKNVFTGEVTGYDQIGRLPDVFGVAPSTLSQWISRKDQPVLPYFVQMKWAYDPTPWREISDPYLEHNQFTGKRAVKIVNEQTGETKIYPSAIECAQDKGLSPTALNYRLKSNGTKIFSDGYRYGYYPY